MNAVVDDVLAIFHARGDQAYLGEPVSLTEHMLQTAAAAMRFGASDSLVVAALLHDFGHLVHGMDEDSAKDGIDTRHEIAGATWLARTFGPAVTEPIRLHVAAKRYLCTIEPTYFALLSPASVHSLMLQGGPLSVRAASQFVTRPFAADAVLLRKWDDSAKTLDASIPTLESLRPILEACMTRAGSR
jgi:phosphonate degradation associated HDIG domain protein